MKTLPTLAGLIDVVIVLAVIGVILYLLEKLPMEDTIRVIIRVVVILAAVLYLVRAFLL